jgi:hypothetical protein
MKLLTYAGYSFTLRLLTSCRGEFAHKKGKLRRAGRILRVREDPAFSERSMMRQKREVIL